MTNPFKNYFDIARRLCSINNALFILSTLLIIAEFLCTWLDIDKNIITIIVYGNCVFIILYQILDLLFDLCLAYAEKMKRRDLFANAFGTKIASKTSQGYYSNTGLPTGVYKLGVNNYESCFFTFHIMKADLWQNVTKVTTVFLVALFVVFIPEKQWLVLLIQCSLPLSILIESIRYFVTLSSLNRMLDDYWQLFENPDNIREANILYSISNYTAILARGRIMLSEKTYSKMNDSLSKEWSEIKNDLHI